MARPLVTFCTICGAVISPSAERCAACGAAVRRAEERRGAALASRRTLLRRGVAVLPVILAVTLVLTAAAREQVARHRQAEWYAQAVTAEEAGHFSAAADLFARAGDYEDAEERRAAALTSYRTIYLDAAAALDAGRYDEAIALLVPLARRYPGESDAMLLLAQAHDARDAALRAEADAAMRRGDWLAAEQALARLEGVTADPVVAAELAALRREHAPLVLGRDDGLYLIGPDGADERLLTAAVPVAQPTWSPDRTQIAFTSPYANERAVGDLYVINADGSGLRRLTARVTSYRWPVWSPDGRRIAYSSFAEFDSGRDRGRIGVRVVEVATGVETDLTGTLWDYASSPTWSPDGTRLAIVTRVLLNQPGAPLQPGPGEVQIMDLASGEVRSLTGDRLPRAWRVSWNPVNDQLIVLTRVWEDNYEPYPTDLYLIDVGTGELTPIDDGPGPVSMAYWSPDGRRFAYVDDGQRVLRIGAPGRPLGWVRLTQPVSEFLSWSGDGSAILAAAPDIWTPSLLIRLDGPVTTQTPVELIFRADWYNAAPPQWSARNPAPMPGAPTTAGTAHDPAPRTE